MINTMRTTVHPDLKYDYFHDINTKEKAYWLGFLYADGFIVTKGERLVSLGLRLSSKDEERIIKFAKNLGLNETKIEHENDRNCCLIRVGRSEMLMDLVDHGILPRKSKVIELPKLDTRELYLAFLLGFFDGDGKQGASLITCGSLKFLEQIKEMFDLPFTIKMDNRDRCIKDRIVRGCAYSMCLGSGLFNEMMDNYADSMHRKRKHFCTREENNRRISVASKKTSGNDWAKNGHKLTITKEELERIVWKKSTTEIARELGVSDVAIARRCKKFGIEKPGRGYWAKEYGVKVSK
jgi:hypothetical protein